MTKLVLQDHAAALASLGPCDIATAYLTPNSFPQPRRVLIDVKAALPSGNATELAEWIVERIDDVRHVEDLHAKVAIGADAAMLGSANFTGGGLGKNKEAGVLTRDPGHLAELRAWFDGLWRGAQGIDPDALRRMAATLPAASRPRIDTTGLFFKVDGSKESDLGPIDGDLLDHLSRFGSPDAAETYLCLAEEIVRTLDRPIGDPSLTVSLPRREWGPRVTVGTTWVLLPSNFEDRTLAAMLLLPEGVDEPPGGEPLGACEAGRWWNLPLRASLLDENPSWLAAASLLKGPTPRHARAHRPDALQAILDHRFRREALARAFGDRPEAERAENDDSEFWARFEANPRPLGTRPAVVQYWKEPSVGNWRNGATGSTGCAQPRLLEVAPGGTVYIVAYAGEGRFYVAARIAARAGGEPELGWHVIAGPMDRYAPGDDTEFLESTLDLPRGQNPSTRSMALRTIRHLSPAQAEAFGMTFAP